MVRFRVLPLLALLVLCYACGDGSATPPTTTIPERTPTRPATVSTVSIAQRTPASQQANPAL